MRVIFQKSKNAAICSCRRGPAAAATTVCLRSLSLLRFISSNATTCDMHERVAVIVVQSFGFVELIAHEPTRLNAMKRGGERVRRADSKEMSTESAVFNAAILNSTPRSSAPLSLRTKKWCSFVHGRVRVRHPVRVCVRPLEPPPTWIKRRHCTRRHRRA